MEFVDVDVVEQIVIRLEVKDLIRCKSVCKSWYSLITSHGFINRHLNQSYNKDCCNDEFGDRRIMLHSEFSSFINHRLVGSSNGLVCIIALNTCKVLVGNPLTKEARQLRSLPHWIMGSLLLCWGFGYDATTDDYKVIVGAQSKNRICVRVLSLKSDVWRVIGYVKHTFVSMGGVLSNGALHWIVKDESYKKLIISYDLSKEEFKEIPQPDDVRYVFTSVSHLGIIKGCLCIYHKFLNSSYVDKWLRKEYNGKQSWERVCEMKYDFVHHLRTSKDYIRPESFFHPDQSVFPGAFECIYLRCAYATAPIFVQSLVSPHVMRGQREQD